MHHRRWHPVAGLLFAALALANVVLTNIPDVGDSTAGTLHFYADASNRHKEVAAAYVGVAAGLAFFVFVWVIAPGRCPALAMASAFSGVTIVAQAAFLAPTASVSLGFSDATTVNPTFARAASTLGDAFLFGAWALAGMALLVAASSLPVRWLRILTRAIGVGVVGLTFTFFPVLLLSVWAVIAAAVLLANARGAESVQPESAQA